MTVKMIMDAKGATDATGSQVKIYLANEVIDTSTEFGKNLAKSFIESGFAVETKIVEAQEIKRARNSDGTLKADDKKTTDYNEAWEGGKAPQKKRSTKKN